MIPFSLEIYNKNPNVPLVTRDGRPVRIISTNGVKEYPICYVFEGNDGTEILGACQWQPTFYWKTELVNGQFLFYTTGGGYCQQCIPYNTETAGLICTSNMPSEIYRIW